MSLASLWLTYSVLLVTATLLGGALPAMARLTHTRLQVMMSFVSGLMLGVAFFHMLPHGIVIMDRPDATDLGLRWAMLGLLLMFLLLRAFHFHIHEQVPAKEHHHDHGCAKDGPPVVPRYTWTGVAVGSALHSIIDGIALGAAMKADAVLGAGGLLGLSVFIAIILHKPLDSLSISALMTASGWSVRRRIWVIGVFAMVCPLAAGVFLGSIDGIGGAVGLWVGAALAVAAGAAIGIALSDLLPEVQFHSHDRLKLTGALMLGVGLALALGLIEPDSRHGVAHSPAAEHVHH